MKSSNRIEPRHQVAAFKLGRIANQFAFLLKQCVALLSPKSPSLRRTSDSVFRDLDEIISSAAQIGSSLPQSNPIVAVLKEFQEKLKALKLEATTLRRSLRSKWHICRFYKTDSWALMLSDYVHAITLNIDLVRSLARVISNTNDDPSVWTAHSEESIWNVNDLQRAYIAGVSLDTSIRHATVVRNMVKESNVAPSFLSCSKRTPHTLGPDALSRWLAKRRISLKDPLVYRFIEAGHNPPNEAWLLEFSNIVRQYPWHAEITSELVDFTRGRSLYCGGSRNSVPEEPTQWKRDRVSRLEQIALTIENKLEYPWAQSNENRDRWMYEQFRAKKQLKEIYVALRAHPEWDQVKTPQAVSQAIQEFTKRNRLAPIISRRGRPRKTTD